MKVLATKQPNIGPTALVNAFMFFLGAIVILILFGFFIKAAAALIFMLIFLSIGGGIYLREACLWYKLPDEVIRLQDDYSILLPDDIVVSLTSIVSVDFNLAMHRKVVQDYGELIIVTTSERYVFEAIANVSSAYGRINRLAENAREGRFGNDVVEDLVPVWEREAEAKAEVAAVAQVPVDVSVPVEVSAPAEVPVSVEVTVPAEQIVEQESVHPEPGESSASSVTGIKQYISGCYASSSNKDGSAAQLIAMVADVVDNSSLEVRLGVLGAMTDNSQSGIVWILKNTFRRFELELTMDRLIVSIEDDFRSEVGADKEDAYARFKELEALYRKQIAG